LSAFYRFFRASLRGFFKVFNGFEVRGAENVPETGGVIVAANHISYLDPPLLAVALRRRVTFMAKQGLFEVPMLGTIIRHFSFPVSRKRPQPSSIKEALRRLRKGELVVIFPEGGLSADGTALDVKRGVSVIAAAGKVPVIPALITGTDKAMPVGSRVLKPAKLTVVFGKPIEIASTESDKDFHERACRDIMEEIKQLKVNR
jgi:1-acyl-sn-glycerol-3-phosphate acyltransferase